MQFKIDKDTDIEQLAIEMATQITAALFDGLQGKFNPEDHPEKNVMVDIFINVRTSDLKNQ